MPERGKVYLRIKSVCVTDMFIIVLIIYLTGYSEKLQELIWTIG